MRSMLFVDDHPIYRDGLQRALMEVAPDLRIHLAAGYDSALEFLALAKDVDFCLADYRLVDGDGISLLEEVRRRHPAIAIGLLCAEPVANVIDRVKAAGGVACLSKARRTEELASAIDTIFNGGLVFDDTPRAAAPLRGLSARRREILKLAGKGHFDRQIGEKLNISESTVRNHWQHIFSHLGANNRTEAVVRAMQLGLL
jgi:DNA-binding NarL/FixJ family response regulator